MTATSTTRSGVGHIVGGAIAAIAAAVLLVAGALALGLSSERDSGGYVSGDSAHYTTPTYALATKSVQLGDFGHATAPTGLIGDVRVRVTSNAPTFVGIARAANVQRYLAGVAHQDVDGFDDSLDATHSGTAPASRPQQQRFWVTSHQGQGDQTLDWEPKAGKWRLVVMNADAGSHVSARVAVGAKFPHLGLAGLIAVLAGGGLLVAAVLLIRQGTRLGRRVAA
jgi:hypothetical protein